MNYEKIEKQCPILICGVMKREDIKFEIESLQDRIKRGLLKVQQLSIIMFHVTTIVSECQRRKSDFLKNLDVDKIYLNKNLIDDAKIFILEEDQQINPDEIISTKQQLINLCNILVYELVQKLGFNFDNQLFQGEFYIDKIINELYNYIFQERSQNPYAKIQEQQILKQLYNIKIIKTIYSEMTSSVYLIQKPHFINCEADQIVVKCIYFKDSNDLRYQYREIKLLELVNDLENCTKMFSYINIGDYQIIFMKYYHLTLENVNNEIAKNQLSFDDLIHLIKQILLALKDLHSRKIIHRDLKPQNIMLEYLDDNQNIQNTKCVLIDFDRSQIQSDYDSMHPSQYHSYYEGTQSFQPPEGTQEDYLPSYDIWQFGYIIQCMILRSYNKQYSQYKIRPIQQEKYRAIFEKDYNELQLKQPKLYPIIIQMTDLDPNRRPNLNSIFDFIQNIN